MSFTPGSVGQPFCLILYDFPHSHGIRETPETFSSKSSCNGLGMWELFSAVMWNIFVLNFPGNLLILCDAESCKVDSPIGFYFYFFLLCFKYVVLLKAAALYVFCPNLFLKCQILSFKRSLSHIVLAWLMNVVNTACFCDGWWCGFVWW
jgi:hypothetical protein